MDQFQRNVQRIEQEANSFIDESFKTLRSAEGAFDMLHNFKHIRSRDAINNTMMKKFNEILSQFEKEVCACLVGVFDYLFSEAYVIVISWPGGICLIYICPSPRAAGQGARSYVSGIS